MKVVIPVCGNGSIEGEEQCEAGNLNGQTCISLGFSGGTLSCDPACDFDTNNCTVCGDGVVNGLEQCDGADLNARTCSNLGFTSGTLTCNSNCTFNTSSCVSGGGGGGGGIPPQIETKVILSGRAYPGMKVTVLKDGQIVASAIADPAANFNVTVSGLSAGNYIFGVYSEDNQKRRSSLLTFPTQITLGITIEISNIYITPTIAVDKSEVKKGDNIAIFGQSTPNSEITIAVNSEQEIFNKIIADSDGIYLYNFDTSPLTMEQHSAKSKSAIGGAISSFGRTVEFIVGTKNVFAEEEVGTLMKVDLNNDGRVNLVDFSIIAYWYKRDNFPKNVDFNGDGKIDLIDFSIMAFYWTG